MEVMGGKQRLLADEGTQLQDDSDGDGDAAHWVLRWVRVTVLPGPVVVKVSVALRELAEVLAETE